MATTDQKNYLFEDFYAATQHALEALESQFEVSGVRDQVFGANSTEQQAKESLRASRAWATLSALYDYAITGIEGAAEGPSDIVIDGSDVLKLVTTENHWPCAQWDDLVAMADGRFALDDGLPVAIQKVALLANVDVRTVRNAVSAGELVSFKREDGVYIENGSVRRWLHGRKGFKPTVHSYGDEELHLEDVNSPAQFGSLLTAKRSKLGVEGGVDKVPMLHPKVTAATLEEIEAGIFDVPLDAVFPLADFYKVGRKELLDCVMRVFFYEELRMLADAPPAPAEAG